MANNLLDRAFSGNQAKIMAKQMKFQSLDFHIWGKLAKFNTPGGRVVSASRQPQVTNSVVVIQSELKRSMGDVLKVPMHRLLDNLPTIGKDQMADHEEEPKVNHAQVPIDLVRHAEKPQDGIMSTQTTKDYLLIKNTKPALLRHYAMNEEYLGCTYAMYNGFSYNVLQSSRFSGHSTITAISHPHIYVAGSGKVSYGVSNYPGTSGYEDAVGTAISGIGASHIFDTDFLRGLKAHRNIARITPVIDKMGNPLRLIFAHPYQIATLEADDLFNASAAKIWAQESKKDNPMLVGCKYIWNNFAIYETDTAVWPVTVSGGDPVWGVTSPTLMSDYQAYSTYNTFAGMVLGAGAMFKALGRNIEFKQRMADYDEILGIAYRSVEGYARGDYWNDDDETRGQYIVNDGSAVFITYAPAPAM
jgi:hypothetical protein